MQGEIDQELFNRKDFVKWLRTLYDAYDLKVEEQLAYEELYQFDSDHFIRRAESFFSFQAGELYQCSIANIVEQIHLEDEPKTIRTGWVLSDL